jgi:hypothetical protein
MPHTAIISRPGRQFAEPGDLLLQVGESVATGVGKDEHPLSAVRGADLGCAEQTPPSIEPELGQRPENVSEISSELWHVLHENEIGSKYANAPLELRPEAGAGAGDALSLAGDGQVLAGEAAADEIDGRSGGVDIADILETCGRRVVLTQHCPGVGVLLGLPLHAGGLTKASERQFDPAIKAGDAREQGADADHVAGTPFPGFSLSHSSRSLICQRSGAGWASRAIP